MIENLEVKADALRELIEHTVGQGDIRRIFRERFERDREEQERKSRFDPETHKVWAKLRDKPAKYREDMVQEVINTYWEVVEEDLDEPDKA